jgi:hypothetical protein
MESGLNTNTSVPEHGDLCLLRLETLVKLRDLITTISKIQHNQEVDLEQLLITASVQVPDTLDAEIVSELIELRNAIYAHQRPMFNLAYFEWKFGWKQQLYHYVRSITRGREIEDTRSLPATDARAIMLFFAQGIGIASIFPVDHYKLKTMHPWGEHILHNRAQEDYPNPYAYLHVMMEYNEITHEQAAQKYFASLGEDGLYSKLFWQQDLPKLFKGDRYKSFFDYQLLSVTDQLKPPILNPQTSEQYNQLFFMAGDVAHKHKYVVALSVENPDLLKYFEDIEAKFLSACVTHAGLMQIHHDTIEYMYTIISGCAPSEQKRNLIMHFVHQCIQFLLSDQQAEESLIETAADFAIAYYDPEFCIEGDQVRMPAIAKSFKHCSREQILMWDGESKLVHEFFAILNMIQLGAMRKSEAVTILKKFAKEYGDTNDFFQACLRSSQPIMREVAQLYLDTVTKTSVPLQVFRRVCQSPLPIIAKITEGLCANSAAEVMEGILPLDYSKPTMFLACLERYQEVEQHYGIGQLTQLYQQTGIIQHKRYTDSLLEYIITTLEQSPTDKQKHIVVISARNHYGEKYIAENVEHYADIAKQAQDNGSALVRYIEVSTKHEMYLRLRQLARRFGKFDTAIIAAHSGPAIINLGEEDITLEQLDVNFGLSATNAGYISNICNEGATVIMDCCKTGIQYGFADVLATSEHIKMVHASTTLNSVDSFVLDSTGSVTPIYTSPEGHRIIV